MERSAMPFWKWALTLLAGVVVCLFEGIVGESPIVAVVVLDSNAMLGGKGLEGTFGGDGFDRGVIDLGMDVVEPTVVVNEDSGTAIALLGKFPF